ncbi:MAG: hypothetical protein ACD_18C00252G0002 [uncultured bacterium]|nr:MAG: hypothetical protein ACD_18C00252G0002 [uncultured bacterium]
MRKFISYPVLSLFSVLFFATKVLAVKSLGDSTPSLTKVTSQTGITEPQLTNVAGNVVTMLFIFAGLIFFVLMVYAGVRWMTARDKAESVEKARNTMIAAVIGLVILMASYAITNFVQTNILSKQGNSPGDTGQTQTLSCVVGSASVIDFCSSNCAVETVDKEYCVSVSGASSDNTNCYLFCIADSASNKCGPVTSATQRSTCNSFTNIACQSMQAGNNFCQLK